MTDREIIERASKWGWYHAIELRKGFVTPSVMLPAIAPAWEMIRKVRERLDYRGKWVLDLGTMDGMWAFEAEQLGAAPVYAADIWQGAPQGQERFNFAREALGSHVIPVPGADVHFLSQHLEGYAFDIIQCLGMLYHLENPMLALWEIRKALNPGGRMLLETACWNGGGNEPAARFNSDGGIYCDSTTFWVPNMAGLLGILRVTGFKVLGDFVFSPQKAEVCRVAAICASEL